MTPLWLDYIANCFDVKVLVMLCDKNIICMITTEINTSYVHIRISNMWGASKVGRKTLSVRCII
jgi:hypothetical protein